MRAEVLETIEGLGDMAKSVNGIVTNEYLAQLSQGMKMDSVEGKMRLQKLNIVHAP